jgi:hypothetical protein
MWGSEMMRQMAGYGPMSFGPMGPHNFVVLSLGDYDQLRRDVAERASEHDKKVKNAYHEGRIAMFCDGLLSAATKQWGNKMMVRVTTETCGFTLLIDNIAYRYSHNRSTNEIIGPRNSTNNLVIHDIPTVLREVASNKKRPKVTTK